MELDIPALFDEHYDEIAAYVMRRLMDRSASEDIAQMTFIEAYDHRESYDPGKGKPRAWLFGIATHLLHRHRRCELRQLRAYSRAASRQLDPDDESDKTCSRLDAHANSGALARALATLSDGDRQVLTLHFWAELSYQEIATAVRIPRGTVGSRLNRARRHVRAQLDPSILEANDG